MRCMWLRQARLSIGFAGFGFIHPRTFDKAYCSIHPEVEYKSKGDGR
jgi:hypothetical protein